MYPKNEIAIDESGNIIIQESDNNDSSIDTSDAEDILAKHKLIR